MRRLRRNGHAGLEFGGSGEDSFVAVVVTKLTGALLFILLLTMVIMALLPKVVDLPASDPSQSKSGLAAVPLEIATPETLPEAIAGRPYSIALAARGGRAPLHWAVDGKLPDGLSFDAELAQIRGTPARGTPEPSALVLRVSDGTERASRGAQLVVYETDQPLTLPSRWKPSLPPIPWHAWLEQGFGFLVLWLVHLVGLSTLGSLERWSLGQAALQADLVADRPDDSEADGTVSGEAAKAIRRRFTMYRTLVRLASLGAVAALALWLAQPRP
jgi:hypothetical protein